MEMIVNGKTVGMNAFVDRIVFNVPVSAKKGYELQLKAEYADGTAFEAGAVFELTVTDDSGMYFPSQTAFIQIAE